MSAGGRGGLGWAILIVALAVPGVLFYNWWSHLKADREKSVAAKARGRVPDGGVFQAPPSSSKLVNPMAPAAPVVSTAPVPTPAPVAAAPAPQTDKSAASAAEPPAVAGKPALPAVSSTTVPGLARDPMISPFDLVRLKEEEEAKLLAQQKLEDERNKNKPRNGKKSAPAPEMQIELQGIISNPDGANKAIVNNEVVGPGEMVGKYRVVRITDLGVTFEYRGKKFSKSVNKD